MRRSNSPQRVLLEEMVPLYPSPIEQMAKGWKVGSEPPRLVNIRGISLTPITLPHIILRSSLHAWPPISLGKGSVSQRPPSHMTPTYFLMQLF